VVGDAKLGLEALGTALAGYTAPADWTAKAKAERKAWDAYVADNVAHGNRPNSYAQAIGVVNDLCDPRDRVVAAAGGLPAEVTANWRTLDIGTVDVEFGFSCMGYEIAGGWGARIAQSEGEPDRDTIVFTGDGSYLLMNSDIYSSVLTQKKLIVLVLDNGGFAVINKLQNNTGNESFNNLIADCPTVPEPFAVDFEAHARSMGADAVTVANPAELGEAFKRAKASTRPASSSCRSTPTRAGPPKATPGGRSARRRSRTIPTSAKSMRSGKPNAPSSGRGSEMKLSGNRFVIIGRAGMDFYPDPPGTKTELATHFFACLGGSSANIGVAICKLGGAADLVTCVSDDAIGRFALNQLDHYGIGRAARPLRRGGGAQFAGRCRDHDRGSSIGHLPQRCRRFRDDGGRRGRRRLRRL
jgi:hypothetical protein